MIPETRPSLYARYLIENGLRDIYETDWGFATYTCNGKECYIIDLYVLPEKRKLGNASDLATKIEQIAKARGCSILTGSVPLRGGDPTRSLAVLLAYGFKFHHTDSNFMWFSKELV